MITEQDLHEAIAELQGRRNPTSNDCIKLAAYYTILNNLQATSEKSSVVVSKNETPTYSYEPSDNTESTITYTSNTDFAKVISGKPSVEMWAVVDELMSTLAYLNPKLYNDAMHKFSE